MPLDRRSLVICDVEGYEEYLLDPIAVPALRQTHILVEVHEGFVQGISDELCSRFQPTHIVERISQTPRCIQNTRYSSLLTKLFPASFVERAIREPRFRDDGWLWMEPKAHR